MSTEVRVPALGESIVDATIATWLKHEGDAIHRGDTLVELETDKVNVEVNAEEDGILQKLIKQEGDTVKVGEIIAVIGIAAGVGTGAGNTNGTTVSGQEQTIPTLSTADAVQKSEPVAQTSSDAQRPPSPLARRIAAENHIDLAQVKGSSPHGRITKDDVMTYLTQGSATPDTQQVPTSAAGGPSAPSTQQPAPPVQQTQAATTSNGKPFIADSLSEASSESFVGSLNSKTPTPAPLPLAAAPQGREERVRMSRRRQTIAQRLVEAQHSAAMLTTFNEVDMTAIMDVRARRKDSFKERNNVSLGFMSFFTRAVVGALKANPRLNAEIQGNEMVLKHYYDIGIAVSADEGLVVPVLRDADRKSFAEIEREIADLAKRARGNSLTLAELQGGTFTITNGGVFGSLLSTPILNAPQVGILGMHKIEQRPIALDGQVVIRPMMYVALSYDHRIVDGSEAVRFLVRVKELLEDPERLLLEG